MGLNRLSNSLRPVESVSSLSWESLHEMTPTAVVYSCVEQLGLNTLHKIWATISAIELCQEQLRLRGTDRGIGWHWLNIFASKLLDTRLTDRQEWRPQQLLF